MSSHAIIKLKLRAVIGAYGFDDVIQYSSVWALNAIPMASLMVAVGRDVDRNMLATIHHAAKTLRVEQKAEVFLKVEVTDKEQAVPGVEDGEIKIFEGKVVGTGWQRTESGGFFTIALLHWLSELNNSSAISASLHPGCPGDMSYPAVFPAFGLDSTTPNISPIPSFVPDLSKSIVDESSFDDLWGNVFSPWLTTLATDDAFDKAFNNGSGAGNPKILDVLKRINVAEDSVPLNVDLSGASSSTFSDSLSAALVNEIGSNWINTTLWGKIIGEWAPAYWFSVVPRVSDALVVPFTGGLQGEPWAVIGDEDYNFADLNSQLQQVLRGVGIIHPVTTSTGFDMGLNIPQVSHSGLLGIYQPDDLTTGMLLYKDAPKWLSNPIIAHMMSADAEGVLDATINTVLDEIDTGVEKVPQQEMAASISALSDIACLYAHQWYVLEALKGRTGEVSGKLRFDIAPGSNVLVVAGGARNVPDSKNVTENIYATVVQVSYMINSESQRAGTSYSLAHVRTEEENKLPSTSVAKPPLYQEAWRGAKLVTDAPGPEKGE